MHVTKGTYLKALLLLSVFSLGTLISFACSYSNLFHALHHHNPPLEKSHGHKDQQQHEHDHSGNHHESPSNEEEKGNCCNDIIVKFQKVEKTVSANIKAPHSFSISILTIASSELASLQVAQKPLFSHKIRWRPPATIQDLRIVIQSFQI